MADVLVPYHRPIVRKKHYSLIHDKMYSLNKPEAVVYIFMITFFDNP